jgi:hypothetical protein
MSKILIAAAAAAFLLAGSGAPAFSQSGFNPLKIAKDAVDLGLNTAKRAVDLGLDTAESAVGVAEDAVTPDRPRPRPAATGDEIAVRDCHSGELYRDASGEWQTCSATQ